jgi:uncharacterized membrane protein YjgN (DUF898 family)
MVVVSGLLAAVIGSANVAQNPDPSSMAGAPEALFLLPIVYLLGAVGIWAYIKAQVQNVVWNEAQLGRHRFQCELRAASLIGVTLTNLLAIIVTLGLFKPFADVRLIKYMAGTFTVVPVGSLDEFLAGEQQQVAAVGDEAVEMFDVGLAF